MSSKPLHRAAAGTALLVLTACGTTVPMSSRLGQPASGGPAVAGSTVAPGASGDTGGLATSGGSVAVGPSGSSGALGSGSNGTTTGGSPGFSSSGGSSVTMPASVPGVSGGYIKVGYVHVTNYGAAQAAAGQSGIGGVDADASIKAVVDDVNKTGGILGLKIKLVPFNLDATDQTTTSDSWQQQECTAWTQDSRVFAAFAGEGANLDQCLSKKGVLEVCGRCVVSAYDDTEYAKFPLLYEPAGASVSRVVPAYIRGLVEAGFFKGTAVKIGLLSFENPTFRRAAGTLPGILRQYGLALTDEGFVQEPQSASDDGPALQQLQSYELKFSGEGVNRVLAFDEGGAILGYGTLDAHNQRWYPHWGVNSTSGPAAIMASGAYDPPDERTGQTVVGWLPGGDMGFGQASTQRPAGLAHCLAVLKAHQVAVSGDNATVAAGEDCNQVYFLRAALQAAGSVSVAAFRAGAATLGTAWPNATAYGTNWTSARRDGAGLYRVGVYNDSCTCFRYVSGAGAM